MQYYQESIALGSKTGISLVSDAPAPHIDLLFAELWRAIFLFERCFSRFLPGSELSLFNRNAGVKQYISPEFHDLLTAARDMARKTLGLYNPFVLPALQKAGYKNSRVPGHEQDLVDDHSNKSVVSAEKLEIGSDWARIPYGTALDFGGCGKGYLSDQMRQKLPDIIGGYWFSFGGDIVAGGLDDRHQPWPIAIESADAQSKNIGSLTVEVPCSIATSGTTVHHGQTAGKTWHHIIDPHTNMPAETDVLLVTVCDSSALDADVLASCAVILGSKKGIQFLKEQGVKAAILQRRTTNGKIRIEYFVQDKKIGFSYA